MNLLAFAKKLRAEKSTPEPAGLPVGTLTAFELYPELRYGEIEGIGTVTIDMTGNIVGFSPSERCTHNGQTTWIPTELVKNLRKEPFTVAGRGKVTQTAAGA